MSTPADNATWVTMKYSDYCALPWIVKDDTGNDMLHPAVVCRTNKDKAGQWTIGLTRTDIPESLGRPAIPSTRWKAFRLKFDVKGDKDADYNKDKIDKAVSMSIVVTDPVLLRCLDEMRTAHEIAAVMHRKALEIDDDTSDAVLRKLIRRNFGWSDHEIPGMNKEMRKLNAKDPALHIAPATQQQTNHGYISAKVSEKKLDLPTGKDARTEFELKPMAFVDRETNESVDKTKLKGGSWVAVNIALTGVSPAVQKGFARWIVFDGLWRYGPPTASGALTVEESVRADLFAEVEDGIKHDPDHDPHNDNPPGPGTSDVPGVHVNANGKRPREDDPVV